jgi:SAM-dependent methyltransferase
VNPQLLPSFELLLKTMMPDSVADRSAGTYDRLAPDYDAQLAGPDAVRIRRDFQQFVDRRIPPGSTLLDFGCGTGLDAAWYAARGHRVLAYDNSPEMLEVLRERCGAELAAGVVDAWSCRYSEFPRSLRGRPKVSAVTANFAVINALPDARLWFEIANEMLTPGGHVFLSALNPASLADLCRVSFWRRVWAHRRSPGIPFPGKEIGHVRYWPWRLPLEAPSFRLVSSSGAGPWIVHGRHPGEPGPSLRGRLERRASRLWPGSWVSEFAFFELEKRG